MRGDVRTCSACGTKAPGPPYPRGWCLNARGDGVGIVCPSCSPSTDGRVVIVRDSKICPEEIARLSTEQLKRVLVVHALAPHPEALEALEGTSEMLAAVRAELMSRGAL
jgi:hypothetical protein